MGSSINASDLFNVDGLVAVITGGGTGQSIQTPHGIEFMNIQLMLTRNRTYDG